MTKFAEPELSILVVTGASGAGKTSAVRALEARRIPDVRCFYFDSIGVPTAEVMQREHGNGERWQAWATQRWLEQLDQLDSSVRVAVLDGQARPSFIADAATQVARRVHTVLLDCEREERERRLRDDRRQSELITIEMCAWASYLRGQADALGLGVVDTTRLTTQAVADHVSDIIDRLVATAS